MSTRKVVIPDGYAPVSDLADDDKRALSACMVIIRDIEDDRHVYGIASRPPGPGIERTLMKGGWLMWYVGPRYDNPGLDADEYFALRFEVLYFKALEPIDQYVDD